MSPKRNAPARAGAAGSRIGHGLSGRARLAVGTVALFAASLAAYVPALRAGYVWDDDSYVTENPVLRSPGGLKRIWLEPTALPQYYPLVHTTYWIEYRLWQLNAFGYHLVNVLLHATAAVLLWLVLRRLGLAAAWLIAAVFALHPVCVESVAWITQRKNVLSGVFYFLSMLAYFRFCGLGKRRSGPRQWRYYALSLALFLAALLSKTVTATLPAAMLVLLWYKRDRLGWSDLLPLAPMLLLGVSMGLMTAYLERKHVLAEGPEWAFGFADRVLIAGRALWFYAGKVFWPRKLIFIYPRWRIDPSAWWQWVYPAAAVGVMAGLALARKRIGKGPLAAVLLFVGTLFPALGFLNVYPMRYSFVADHFQYLACISLIALAAAAAARAFTRARSRWRAGAVVLGGGLLVLLAVTTWRRGHIYRDKETLWLDTLAKDPGCWMAHHNYGLLLQARGLMDEAIAHYREALRLKPDNHRALTNLGVALGEKGRTDEAIARYRQAVRIRPDYAYAHFCLAHALRRNGRLEEAIHHYRQALRIQPQSAPAHFYLADCLLRQAHADQAIEHFSRAVQLEPDHAESHVRLADALKLRGRAVEAAEHYGRALRLRADFPTALNGLAQLRATSPDPALRDGPEAVRLAQRACRLTQYAHPVLLDTLAAAYAEAGRFDEAITTAEKALKLAQDSGQTDFAARVASRLELYRNGRPYHLSPAP